MKCPTCGRFMKQGGYYSNEHDDSWTPTWRCSNRHDEQIGSAYAMSAQPSEPLSHIHDFPCFAGQCPVDHQPTVRDHTNGSQ